METPCLEHAKLNQQIEDVNKKLDKIDNKLDTIKTSTDESRIDRAWINKELIRLWTVMWFVIASIVGGAIKLIFFP